MLTALIRCVYDRTKTALAFHRMLSAPSLSVCRGRRRHVTDVSTGWLKKSKLLIFAVNENNASQTRVSFAKFIPKLVEKMFDMCSIVPNYSFSILKFFKDLIFFTNFTHNNDLKNNTQLDRYET